MLAGIILFSVLPAADISAQAPPVKINVQTKQGAIKPVNGVCNGPVSVNGLVDCSHYFKQAGFPYSRVCSPYGPNPREVDIHTIFKDFNADVDDPANYDFYN